MLELSHVTFRYAEGLPDVLKDISLSFDKGEFFAITGRKRLRQDDCDPPPDGT